MGHVTVIKTIIAIHVNNTYIYESILRYIKLTYVTKKSIIKKYTALFSQSSCRIKSNRAPLDIDICFFGNIGSVLWLFPDSYII